MRDESVLIPGGRDVRATLDTVGSDAVVVACPPHPEHRGHRGDERLVAVSEELAARGVDCLRIDYGPWAGGRDECTDATNAVDWARNRYDRVALFGYSFGGAVALLVAAEVAADAVSALAPVPSLSPALDVVAALDRLDGPVQVVYGVRDATADWKPVVDAARAHGASVVELSGDHFFIGQAGAVGETVATFLAAALGESN